MNGVSGSAAPSLITAAMVITLLVEPGSNTSVTAEFRFKKSAVSKGLFGSNIGAFAKAKISPFLRMTTTVPPEAPANSIRSTNARSATA